VFLQAVGVLLTFEFYLFGLKGAGIDKLCSLEPGCQSLRSSIGVEENVTILEVLHIRTVLQVLLEGIAAFKRGDGSIVDLEVGSVFGIERSSHSCRRSV
jgi:hypothetical protein